MGEIYLLDNWIRLTFQSAIDLKGAASNSVFNDIIQSNINGGTPPLLICGVMGQLALRWLIQIQEIIASQ